MRRRGWARLLFRIFGNRCHRIDLPIVKRMPVNEQGAVLIVPALNEETAIGGTLASIPAGLFEQVIVADNGSTDQTAEIAHRCGAKVVIQPCRGYGAACLRALDVIPRDRASSGLAIVFLQADGSEDPAQAISLLAPIFDGRAEMVLGSRVLGPSEPGALAPFQRFGDWVATRLIRVFWGHSYSDLGPFRAIRLDALDRLGMRDRSYGWTIEMQVKAIESGLRVLEIPVKYRVRAGGQSKVAGSWRGSLAAGIRILRVIGELAAHRKKGRPQAG